MSNYGSYAWPCERIPSLTICNLFVRQLLDQGVSETEIFAQNLTRSTAGVGVQPSCSIPSLHASGSNGNVANIVLCALSVFVALFLAFKSAKRVAAVGKSEMAYFNMLYAVICVFQLLGSGSFINQGSTALVWLTGIHLGLITALFYALLWLSLLALQFVEDGRPISYILLAVPSIILTVATTYIALDVGFGVTDYFETNIDRLQSAWLFSLTSLWPAVSIFAFVAINLFVSLRILREKRPVFLFLLTLFIFALAEGARYALSHTICTGSDQKVDGSFLGTLLETGSLVALHFAWKCITESDWDEAASSALF